MGLASRLAEPSRGWRGARCPAFVREPRLASGDGAEDRYHRIAVPTPVIATEPTDRLHADAPTVADAVPGAQRHSIPASIAGTVSAHVLDQLTSFFKS
jgi:hypothetical protein